MAGEARNMTGFLWLETAFGAGWSEISIGGRKKIAGEPVPSFPAPGPHVQGTGRPAGPAFPAPKLPTDGAAGTVMSGPV